MNWSYMKYLCKIFWNLTYFMPMLNNKNLCDCSRHGKKIHKEKLPLLHILTQFIYLLNWSINWNKQKYSFQHVFWRIMLLHNFYKFFRPSLMSWHKQKYSLQHQIGNKVVKSLRTQIGRSQRCHFMFITPCIK